MRGSSEHLNKLLSQIDLVYCDYIDKAADEAFLSTAKTQKGISHLTNSLYGTSVLEGAAKDFKRLRLMEDAVAR